MDALRTSYLNARDAFNAAADGTPAKPALEKEYKNAKKAYKRAKKEGGSSEKAAEKESARTCLEGQLSGSLFQTQLACMCCMTCTMNGINIEDPHNCYLNNTVRLNIAVQLDWPWMW